MDRPAPLHLRFDDHSVELDIDSPEVLEDVRRSFAALVEESPVPADVVRRVTVRSKGRIHRIEAVPAFSDDLGLLNVCHSPRALARQLKHYVIQAFVAAASEHLWMHAAAVTRDDCTVLLVGPWGSGKSTMATTLCERGWQMLADDVAVLTVPELEARGFPLEPSVRQATKPVVRNVSALPRARIDPGESGWAESGPRPQAIVFPAYEPNSPGGAFRVLDGEATLVLLSNVLNMGDHEADAVPRLAAMLTEASRFALLYRYPERGADALEAVLRGDAEIDERLHPLSRRPEEVSPEVERGATPWDGVKRRLTIGMATYDDFDGAYFTIQSLRMSNQVAKSDLEIIVVDNHPEGAEAEDLSSLANWIPGFRYVPNEELQGTATRDMVFREATSDWVFCLDSHVLLEPGALDRLLAYVESEPDCLDLLQGPLIYDDLTSYASHFDPKWRAGMYGVWGTDERASDSTKEPFEVPMQGLGLFGCRRDAWLGFNPRFSGFGGEEFYIHEKFRQAGRKTRCLPFLRWLHRFQRPSGMAYRNLWADRVRNYAIGFDELDISGDELESHFEDLIGGKAITEILEEFHRERSGPLYYFDAVYVAHSADRNAWSRRTDLGPALRNRARKFKTSRPVEALSSRLTTHRAVVAHARKLGMQSVVLVEEGVQLDASFEECIAASVAELRVRPWSVMHLGWRDQVEIDRGERCRHLREPGAEIVGTEVVAYHRDFFDAFLAATPDEDGEVERWLERHLSLEYYLREVAGRYASAINVIRPSEPNEVAEVG